MPRLVGEMATNHLRAGGTPVGARPLVIVADDVSANRELLEAYLTELNYDVRHAHDGVEALSLVEEAEPDLILLDIDMPRMDGITLCRELKQHPTRRLIPVVLITVLEDRATRLRGLEAGCDDFITKPFDPKELLIRTRVLLHDRELNKRLDGAQSVVLTLARVVEARDLYTVHHAERVARASREIGGLLGLDEHDLDVLYTGGVLHDVGKAVIPAEVLLKRGSLSDEEMAIMRRHGPVGERICLPLRSTKDFLPIIRHHHERWDGTGYPDKLTGSAIPRSARIAAVSDAWDAMISDRPYRAALDPEEALRRLRGGAGTQWDAEFVDAMVHLIDAGVIARVWHESVSYVTA